MTSGDPQVVAEMVRKDFMRTLNRQKAFWCPLCARWLNPEALSVVTVSPIPCEHAHHKKIARLIALAFCLECSRAIEKGRDPIEILRVELARRQTLGIADDQKERRVRYLEIHPK